VEEDWPKFDRFQKVCWYWNKCNEILEQEFGNEGDFLLMKFEELFSSANNYRGICKMLQFFQINVPQGMDENTLAILMKRGTNSSERIVLDGAETWTDKQKRDFDTLTYSMRKKRLLTAEGLVQRGSVDLFAIGGNDYSIGER
jgi:hypothetical protein